MEQKRERFSSRLGFILISAGCAIGLGNVWKFPYITGQYGGAAFVLIYIAFLILMGIPILVAELSVGRGSQRSIACAMDVQAKAQMALSIMSRAARRILMMFCHHSSRMAIISSKTAAGGFEG